MNIQTILLLVGAAILALGVALFQYLYKSKPPFGKLAILAFLRFLSVFGILLLLINPKIKQHSYEVEKPVLAVVVDHSSSIEHLGQVDQANALVRTFEEHPKLSERFELSFYSFGARLQDTIASGFKAPQTNIAGALKALGDIYDRQLAPIVLMTDGRQTYGAAYEYMGNTFKQQIYPIVLGDTMAYPDLRIKQLNVNKYAYLKNQFPVEAMLMYSGKEKISSRFEVFLGGSKVYSERLSFSASKNAAILQFNLPANKAGVQSYRTRLQTLPEEKNTVNNQKNFAVEVIDQKTNVLIVSAIVHPDLGALKRAITSNGRSSVEISKPTQIKNIADYQLVILYQPDASFKTLYQALEKHKLNRFTIAGSKTDWNFLNTIQSRYRHELGRQVEHYEPVLNTAYSTFLVGNSIGFYNYPPLLGVFGDPVITAPHQILLHQKISGVSTTNPLLATLEENGNREAILFGEDLWKWRAHAYVDSKSFEAFDVFFGKLLQYLAANKKRSRLEVFSESFYYGNAEVKVQASYFTKNYEFDRRGQLTITLKNEGSGEESTLPLVLKNANYEVDLSALAVGKYRYTVRVSGEQLSSSGHFTILDFDVEQQFLSAAVGPLQKLASSSGGQCFFPQSASTLIDQLLEDERYQPIQKQKEQLLSMIDWVYLLLLILSALSVEWFLRKYKGLI